jgi:hypothetical protein
VLTRGEFEKTKPICRMLNELKSLSYKELRKNSHLRAAKKQSQSKPISEKAGFIICHSCENRNPDLLTVLDSASSAE